MADSPDTPAKLAGPSGHAAGERASAGSVTNDQPASAAVGGPDQMSRTPRLRSCPPLLQSLAGSTSRRTVTTTPARESAGQTADPPGGSSAHPSSSTAAQLPTEEEELLEGDEVMSDVNPLTSAASLPVQGEVPAATRAIAAAAGPSNPSAEPLRASGKRKKSRRGGRRHRRKVSGQADVSRQRVEPVAPRAAASTPAGPGSLARRGQEKSPCRAFAVSRLPAWDKLPARQRRVYSTQERKAFRKDGVLVSRFDIPLYFAVSRYNAGSLYQTFPRAPKWWPEDWGDVPVTLPWEVCLYRAQLVAADTNHPLWARVYQKFLEQLARGWDLHFQEVSDRSQIAALPADLAKSMIDGGAFAFAMGPPPLPSFQFFLERHEWQGAPPVQRFIQSDVWDRIEQAAASMKQSALQSKSSQACDCSQRLARASKRLGLEAKVLEATSDLESDEVFTDVEKLASISAAALHICLGADMILRDIRDVLRYGPHEPQDYVLERAREYSEQLEPLAGALPRRYRECYERLQSRPRGGD